MRRASGAPDSGTQPARAGAAGAETGVTHPGPGTGPGTDSSIETGDAETRAREICLWLLTIAPRTAAELARTLRRRGVPQATVDQVLRRFTDVGLIDDAAFAAAWVESRHHSRGLSRRMLAAELRQRGVHENHVRDAISGLDPDEEAATARRLIEKRLVATRGQPAPVRARRLAGVLARKGYPPAMVFRVVREAMEQDGIAAADAGLDDTAEIPDEPEDPGT